MRLQFIQLLRATFGAGLVLALSFHGVLHVHVACHDGHVHGGELQVRDSVEGGCSHHHAHDAVVNAADLRIPQLGCAVCAAALDGAVDVALVEAGPDFSKGAPAVLSSSPCRAADGFIRRYQGRAPPVIS